MESVERMEHQHNYLATDSTVAHTIIATIFAIVIVALILIPTIIIETKRNKQCYYEGFIFQQSPLN